MEIVLVTFGGIFVLLSLSLGAVLQTRSDQSNQSTLSGDRIAAAFIGMGVIATGIVLKINAPMVSVISTLSVTAGLTVLYSLYLLGTRSR